MSVQLPEVRGETVLAAVSSGLSSARARVRPEKPLRYELNVVAGDVAAMVASIGGWLFDRAMAGWRVSVAVDGCELESADERALWILGVKAVDPSMLWPSEADAVAMTAIGTGRVESDDPALRTPGDLVLYGPHPPRGAIRRLQYRPSAAASAYKAHALAVVDGCHDAVGAAETMFRFGNATGLLDADLVPVC